MSEPREITVVSTLPLTDEQTQLILAVSIALSGVRMDFDLQLIVDIVVELYNEGHPWDEIGLAVLGAQRGEGIH